MFDPGQRLGCISQMMPADLPPGPPGTHTMTNDALATSVSNLQHANAFFAHEVRNLLNVAILSFETLKTTGGNVAGSSGHVLNRSLNDLRTLINRSLSEVRIARRGTAPPTRTAAP